MFAREVHSVDPRRRETTQIKLIITRELRFVMFFVLAACGLRMIG